MSDNGSVIICGGQRGTAARRDGDCPNVAHDWPLPTGYNDRADEAHWRLRNGWRSYRCPQCGLYGWTAGQTTDVHIRRLKETTDDE